ncbi:hypothetical protein FD49_GL001372 [Latilactobacillus sakei subsp. sakei DSM 20017 = JCM 1157]|uniref:SMI1/KNR4 family protein n=1 Tax=Latilactobacillus sakei TaxID=1599 RepID=UPI000501E73F|nr:SMI1/KNR4 family protein [Latilactobacillus sakei]AST84165.1 SMI1/KNR4 family protein [Latilactobacillus sakei]AWZ46719.1 SMI1/KNR4 family protein [Latilactobacillus sakei]KGB14621.1 hypothetical protein KY41_06170 [Latilactobacillus sakei]KRK70674.1 hypothetical protein FD49_GL001372 [Latilactobacillus sakei subsp. sakei DSM 20017 = JCM 1157]MDB1553540.1 SMI1/KNR4 family protein [Latilactobacillus sakei]
MFSAHPTIADSGLIDPRFIKPNAALPADYLALCQETNGGFLSRFSLPTSEPTSDGLDHVECHYLAGIATGSQTVIEVAQWPDYLIPFSQHGTQYFAFDYQQSPDNPSIRYIDTEVDQWLTVASSFSQFLAQLGTKPIVVPETDDLTLTPLQRNHYLLIAPAEQLMVLLALYEADSPKDWYLDWLLFFAQSGTLEQQKCALDAYHTQRLYFKRQLPQAKSQQLTQIFAQQPALLATYQAYQKQWSPL